MYNDSLDTAKHRMLQNRQSQQLFYIPKIKNHYGFEVMEEAKRINKKVKLYLILIILVTINLCIWL